LRRGNLKESGEGEEGGRWGGGGEEEKNAIYYVSMSQWSHLE